MAWLGNFVNLRENSLVSEHPDPRDLTPLSVIYTWLMNAISFSFNGISPRNLSQNPRGILGIPPTVADAGEADSVEGAHERKPMMFTGAIVSESSGSMWV